VHQPFTAEGENERFLVREREKKARLPSLSATKKMGLSRERKHQKRRKLHPDLLSLRGESGAVRRRNHPSDSRDAVREGSAYRRTISKKKGTFLGTKRYF